MLVDTLAVVVTVEKVDGGGGGFDEVLDLVELEELDRLTEEVSSRAPQTPELDCGAKSAFFI